MFFEFEVLTEVTSCSMVEFHWRFGGTFCSHLQDHVSKERAEALAASCWFVAWDTLRPWRYRLYVSTKCEWTFTRLHYITVQKAVFLGVRGSLLSLLKIRIMKCKVAEVSHRPIELTECLENSVCGVMQIGAFFWSNGWKSELSNVYWWTYLISNFNKICETVTVIRGNGYLWPYVNRALL
jgi:hypothetical protein